MKTIAGACLVAAAVALGHAYLSAAETARFKFVAAAYADETGTALNAPEGVACGRNGLVVVGDTGNGRLVRFSFVDNVLTGGTAIKVPELTAPSRVELSSKGDIFALDAKQRRVVRLGAAGEFKGALAFDGAPAPATIVPKAFTLDQGDNIYVLDEFSARVLVLDPQGKFQRVIPLPADIGFATDLAADASGRLIVIDSVKRRLFAAAKDTAAFTQLGGDLSASLSTIPTAVTPSRGVLFVLESTGSIVSFGSDGAFLARQLSPGWEEGRLNYPTQLCISDSDDAFIADRDNSRIQVFRLIR